MRIDFHSHILPGIDDGSADVNESIRMLQMERKQGIEVVVATPHFYPQRDTLQDFLFKRDQAYMRLFEAMHGAGDLPQVIVGAEVYYYPGISESDVLADLTIDGTNCILIEMPMTVWTDAMYRDLEQIHVRCGITPIIAHVNRYIKPLKTYGIPQRLQRRPVWVQSNGSFFLQRSTRRMALRMLEEGKIHLLGSDCHNLTSRPPNLDTVRSCISHHLGEEVIDSIRANESEIIPVLKKA